MVCLGIDVGGTKMLAALVDAQGQILESEERPTDEGSETISIVKLAGDMIKRSGTVGAIGLAVAGFVELKTGRIVFAPNLSGLNPGIAGILSDELKFPVTIDNDSNAAAWAEHQLGAGRGTSNMLMVTVGTGIGGGAIVDGKLLRGSRGFAAEFGHMVAVVEGNVCSCGRQGCLEATASGTALAELARTDARRNPASFVLKLAGGDKESITGAMVGKALAQGDQDARRLFEELGKSLGLGLAGLAFAFDPELIVVGGGVGEVGDAFLKPAAAAMQERFEPEVGAPPLVPAKLGNDAGVIGAALLAQASRGL